MFYLKGIPIHFRKLTYDDLKMSYYNLMHLLSDTNIELINTLSLDELFTKLNDDYYIFVIVNIDNDFIIGSGTIKVLNKKTRCSVCFIKDININKDFEQDDKLYVNFLKYLIDYSRYTEGCIKYILSINESDQESL